MCNWLSPREWPDFAVCIRGYQKWILQRLLVPQRARWAHCTHQAPPSHTLLSICPSGEHLSTCVLGLASTESDPPIPLGTLCHQPPCDDTGPPENNTASASEEPPYTQPAVCLHCETETNQRWVSSKPVSTFVILPGVGRTQTSNKRQYSSKFCCAFLKCHHLNSLETMDMVSNTRAITETNPGLLHTILPFLCY